MSELWLASPIGFRSGSGCQTGHQPPGQPRGPKQGASPRTHTRGQGDDTQLPVGACTGPLTCGEAAESGAAYVPGWGRL